MALAFDNSLSLFVNPGSTVSGSISLSGTNKVVIVGEVTNAASDITTAPTVNGVTATKVNATRTPSGNFLSLWFVSGDTNLASGANTIVLNASSGASALYGMAVSYNGADPAQTNMVSSSVVNTGTSVSSLTSSLTTVNDNSIVVMFGNDNSGAATAGTGSTFRIANASDVGTAFFDNGTPKTPVGAVSMQFTFSAGANVSAILAQIQPFVASNANFFLVI